MNVYLKFRPNSEMVLHDISFKVNPREKIAIVGRTGAGKSTIGLALTRMVEVCQGQILIDGVDIGLVPLHKLRAAISVIPQDPVIFKGSLRFNLDPESKHSP